MLLLKKPKTWQNFRTYNILSLYSYAYNPDCVVQYWNALFDPEIKQMSEWLLFNAKWANISWDDNDARYVLIIYKPTRFAGFLKC